MLVFKYKIVYYKHLEFIQMPLLDDDKHMHTYLAQVIRIKYFNVFNTNAFL
jgi:hypothetical protein